MKSFALFSLVLIATALSSGSPAHAEAGACKSAICKIDEYSDGRGYIFYNLTASGEDVQSIEVVWPNLWSEADQAASKAKGLARLMKVAGDLKKAGVCKAIVNTIDGGN